MQPLPPLDFGLESGLSVKNVHRRALVLDRRRVRALLRLAETLERLPSVAAAFEAGRLGWTKVREIAPVAHEGNEEEWLERALTLTSRELEQAVARAGGRPSRMAAAAEVVAAPDGNGEEVELRLRLPVSVFGLWQDAVRKAREEGGGAVTEPEALEYACRSS